MEARLANARIHLQIDLGFGDAITPVSREAEYPTLLPFPAPRLTLYPAETVVADKWQAIVDLGMANTRHKDFYDLWVLSQHLEFEGNILTNAICSTFEGRQTMLALSMPQTLHPLFTQDAARVTQWQAFRRKNNLEVVPKLSDGHGVERTESTPLNTQPQ